jgi:hypothetical protein
VSDPLPWEILLGELPDGYHYQLPARQLGRLRFVGLFLILSGLTGGGLALLTLLHFGWTALPAAWLLVPALALALLVGVRSAVRLGFLSFCGHSQVHLRSGRLTALEYAGLFLRRRGLPCTAVRRLTITAIPWTRLAVIVAECDGGRRLWLAPGYPVRLLAPLARDIARRCAQLAANPEIPVVESVAGGAGIPSCHPSDDGRQECLPHDQECPLPPTGCRVRAEELADGVTLVVPPLGVWRGSRGLFPFALLWCGVMVLATGLVVGVASVGPASDWGGFAVHLGVCWAVSLGLLALAVARGRRRAVLTVSGEKLRVQQFGLIRGSRHEWARDELLEITVGPSFLREHDAPLPELKVWEFPGSFTGLFAGRDAEELAYLATRLRDALELPLLVETAPRLHVEEALAERAPALRRAS